MAAVATSALPYGVIAEFRYRNEDCLAIGCTNKLQILKRNSLVTSTVPNCRSYLDAAFKSELTVSHALPSTVDGIVPLSRIDLLLAYGESYLAIFTISKLLIGGRLCLANIMKLPSTVVAVHGTGANRVRILFKSGLIQDVKCEVGENIQFSPYRSTRFSSDFNVKSLSFDDGNYIAYNADEQTLSTVVFNPIGPITTQLAKFYTVLKRYFLLRYRLINDRYLFVLDSMGILTIQDCSIDKRLFIEGICITSFEIFGRDNEILLLLGDATGYVHLYSVLLNPLQMMSKEWKFMISTAKISLLHVFPAEEGSILVCGDSMGHLASIHIPSLRKFNNIVPKTILTIPTRWNATSIYSLREIPTPEKKIIECIMLDNKSNMFTFRICDDFMKDRKAVEIKKIKKTIFKTFTCIVGYGKSHVKVRINDHKTQFIKEPVLIETTQQVKMLGFFYLDPYSYVIQTSCCLELRTIGRNLNEKSVTTETSALYFFPDNVIFSHMLSIYTRNSLKSNYRALIGISSEEQPNWTSSIYGCLTPSPNGNINHICEKLQIQLIAQLPGRVVDCNSFANGEVYVLLAPPMLIRFDILHVEEEPNVKLVATGRWSLRGIFGKVYRLLPCPGYENSDILVTGTKQFNTATGLTEDDFRECLKTISFRRKHETEVIVWQVHEWREWGRSVLPSRTKSWDVDVDFDRTSLRINTVSKMNGSGQRDFKYEQFRRPELLQCSAPVSLRATSKMKVLATADGKCPLKGAAICILTGDHRGLVSVLALIDKIWMIKASFQVQGEITALDVSFHLNFGFNIACGSLKSSDPVFFSISLSDMGKGNVRLCCRSDNFSFAEPSQNSFIRTVQLWSLDNIFRKDVIPAVAFTYRSDHKLGVFFPFGTNGSCSTSNWSISWKGEHVDHIRKTRDIVKMFCNVYKRDLEYNVFLLLDDKGVLRLSKDQSLRINEGVSEYSWDAGLFYAKTQLFCLPCCSQAFSIITGGFDGTVSYYFYDDNAQKCLIAAVDKIHTDSIVDTCYAIVSFKDGKHLLIFSVDISGIVVYRKLKLTASRIIPRSAPIRIQSSVKQVSGVAFISHERKIFVSGEGFELIPVI